MGRGAERKIVPNAIFRGKRHDNKILKVNILLPRNFVVMAQAPSKPYSVRSCFGCLCRFVCSGACFGVCRFSNRSLLSWEPALPL